MIAVVKKSSDILDALYSILNSFDIYLNVKTMRKIAQIFVAFSEKLNFMNWIFVQCIGQRQVVPVFCPVDWRSKLYDNFFFQSK